MSECLRYYRVGELQIGILDLAAWRSVNDYRKPHLWKEEHTFTHLRNSPYIITRMDHYHDGNFKHESHLNTNYGSTR